MDATQAQADGYYHEEELSDDELDLSFLDEDEPKKDKETK